MGKKRVSVLGSETEEAQKAKRSVQREQKKLRGGKVDKSTKSEVNEPSILESATPSSTEAKVVTKRIKTRSKAYQTAKAKVNSEQNYNLAEALGVLRTVSYSKANGTVELHINLKEKGQSFEVELPHSTGKTRRIAVVDADTLAKIEAGQLDFDVLVASPGDMPKLVKFAKVLGPKGLMPNPKTGTIVADPQAAAKKMASSSSIRLKTEKDAPVIHTTIGKLAMSDSDLTDNITVIVSAVSPKATKIILKSAMSPAIKLALA